MYIAIVAAIPVVLAIGWAIKTSNRFRILIVKISEADSGISVALTKRYDTLTKMLDVVKAYAKHETEVFENIVKLRAGMSMAERADAHQKMITATDRLNILAENYPELRSAENFKQLQFAIVDAEDHLQAARRVYNMNVSSFNQSIVVFPSSIIAGAQNHQPRDFFEADAEKRTDVKMSF